MESILSDKVIIKINRYNKYPACNKEWLKICKKCGQTYGNHTGNKECHGSFMHYFEKDEKLTAAAIAYFKLQGGKFYD